MTNKNVFEKSWFIKMNIIYNDFIISSCPYKVPKDFRTVSRVRTSRKPDGRIAVITTRRRARFSSYLPRRVSDTLTVVVNISSKRTVYRGCSCARRPPRTWTRNPWIIASPSVISGTRNLNCAI